MRLPNEFTLEEMTLEKLNEKVSEPNFVGIIRDLPEELYHKCRGLSRSAIVEAKTNLSDFLAYLEEERKETAAMVFGTALHCAILEPAKFQKTYVAAPAKEDYKGLLESSDELKKHLTSLIDLEPSRKAVKDAEKKLSDHEKRIPNEIKQQEDSIKDLTKIEESKEFKTKKEKTEAIKIAIAPLKEALTNLKKSQKEITTELKAQLKDEKKKLSELEGALKGTKAKMTAEIRKHDKDTPIWGEIMDSFNEKNKEKIILSQKDLRILTKIMSNAQKRTHLKVLMSSGIPELTVFWTDAKTGVLLKIRVDYFSMLDNAYFPLDWKSCRCAEAGAFSNDAGNKNYHIQDAMYVEGLNVALESILPWKIPSMIFVAAEKEKGCEVNEITLAEASREKGYKNFREALDRIASYYNGLANNEEVYTGYEQGISTVEMPIYHLA